ncbi:chemotaxis-specific protein-glutamate methyltransferase CheB [Paenibacillus sp. P96]|uniref:Protein-glutamate methylesterase/protein-glutamine glutaminase n=1 Tax=Paenibacillus zeirhizosphaerae TaxID=2987519 RepID=A0ABT9FS22_9BACL|nr:chemotaxis response regulator protein-glutamate methylesterase [Paenibacillus sp. P96]MDP4097523.1 chemotaxis-specific protein-glutamate methyltransferase CheB [Paenibacillus sp. P96]
MAVFRVLIVDDSAFMRKIISDLIVQDTSFEIAGTAVNGREALDKIRGLKPDLVTMDVEMPEMNGLEALKLIMKEHPLPVIMLSGINEEGMKETIMALEAGAFDFIRKPSVSHSQDIQQVGASLREQMRTAMQAVKQRADREEALKRVVEERAIKERTVELKPLVRPLIPPAASPPRETAAPQQNRQTERPGTAPFSSSKVNRNTSIPDVLARQAAKTTDNKKPKPELQKRAAQKMPEHPKKPDAPLAEIRPVVPSLASTPSPLQSSGGSNDLRKLVAVGCSTGGPRALKTLLESLPGNFPAPIVIVQHMPPNFTRSLAQRLNSLSRLKVVEAEQGMMLENGTAYVAPGGYQMKITGGHGSRYTISLTSEEPRNGHRPSVDTMFESLVPFTSLERHLVLLTGMGSDGAKMMKLLYDKGVQSTFAENEETCVVYGMPRSAVELNCVRHLLPLQEIGPKLIQVVK